MAHVMDASDLTAAHVNFVRISPSLVERAKKSNVVSKESVSIS